MSDRFPKFSCYGFLLAVATILQRSCKQWRNSNLKGNRIFITVLSVLDSYDLKICFQRENGAHACCKLELVSRLSRILNEGRHLSARSRGRSVMCITALFLALSLFLPQHAAAEDDGECDWFGEQAQSSVRPSVQVSVKDGVPKSLRPP
jgi:hypothetical protein